MGRQETARTRATLMCIRRACSSRSAVPCTSATEQVLPSSNPSPLVSWLEPEESSTAGFESPVQNGSVPSTRKCTPCGRPRPDPALSLTLPLSAPIPLDESSVSSALICCMAHQRAAWGDALSMREDPRCEHARACIEAGGGRPRARRIAHLASLGRIATRRVLNPCGAHLL